ncbi:CPBP family intramembrane glutamic endopeptidase [Paraclostridium bifermentans]|uniref:CPBP family intramembrane glutamic endopeptidase n=1 Tax=Paraclostridium bifermentans TaxID=1490 RepID=UPI003A7F4B9C
MLISIIINLISIKKFGSIIFSFDSFLTNILIGLSIASFSALIEELSWRGFLYNELSYLSLFKVLTFISFVWAFWHTPVAILYKYPIIPLIGSIINFIQMFFISLIITYIRYKSNSILAASFSHGLFNTLVLSSCIAKIDSIFISILLSALIVFILFIYEFKASIK